MIMSNNVTSFGMLRVPGMNSYNIFEFLNFTVEVREESSRVYLSRVPPTVSYRLLFPENLAAHPGARKNK